MYEDIFNENSLKVIVRFNRKSISRFDRDNSLKYDRLKTILEIDEHRAYFIKIDDNFQKIIIPIDSENGQLELQVSWDNRTFSYVAEVSKDKKTAFKSAILLPKDKPTFIQKTCQLKFIAIDESYRTDVELENLYKRISNLEITSQVDITQQQDIWDKYIEAQELIISKLQEPFDIIKYHELKAIKNQKGDDVFKYIFQVDLNKPRKKEAYLDVEKALKDLDIDGSFNLDGEIKLKFDDIFRGLDAVIERDYSNVIERAEKIGAILKIYPFRLQDRILNRLKETGLPVNITSSEGNKKVYIKDTSILNKKGLEKILESEFGLKFHQYQYEIEVLNHGNIIENKKINKKYHLIFSRKFKDSNDTEPEWLLPIPNDNTFRIQRSNLYDIRSFLKDLARFYGEKNILIKSTGLVFKGNESMIFNPDFDAEFWQDLKRDLYPYGLENNFYESSSSIFLEFKTEAEFNEQLELLKGLNKFNINYNPEGYEFKIQTSLISEANEKAIFEDKLNKLRGVEFVVELPSESRRKDTIPIGKLIAHESNSSKLVFSVANNWDDDKKAAKALIKYLDKEPEVTKVQANLRGDEVKTSWLREAMAKITRPSDKPNGKPINENLGEFIFDASKASPILRDISETSIDWQTARKHQLLTLNDSQLKAILSALNAEDLALLQGPPGTGKTTVIAELIWQMIRKNPHQRILLTSETNLAVDNALEKLLNKEHTLVKPLRFGKPHKFEEEGRKYAHSRIMEWVGEKQDKDEYEEAQLEEIQDDDLENEKEDVRNNAVQKWMERIASKAQRNTDSKYAAVLKDWTMEMAYPTQDMKVIFKDKYLKYANVVGSTCSSCGSWAFNKDYQSTFNINLGEDSVKVIKEILFLIEKYPNSNKIWRLLNSVGIETEKYTTDDFPEIEETLAKMVNINFDSVIMDEASKATPPELLLPLCFGKKSVIIGDHRQLPPMIHDKDFRETLEELDDEKATQLAKEINRKFVETSQFERLILNPKVHKSIKATFNTQYRMHPKINDVIKQFYLEEGGLECGLDDAKVDIKDLNEVQSRHHGLSYPNFLDHDTHTIWIDVNEPEQKEGTSRINNAEIEAVNKVFELLSKSNGFEAYQNHWKQIKDKDKSRQEQEIGLISFYGKQVNELKTSKRKAKNLGIDVRLKTVDKFQGMERNIVIVSTVRSNKLKTANQIITNRDIGFAKLPQRLNVALSRAKRLLIVVGNKDFFYQYKNPKGEMIYKNAINEIKRTGKIINYKTLMNL
jgi:hypothetical protein